MMLRSCRWWKGATTQPAKNMTYLKESEPLAQSLVEQLRISINLNEQTALGGSIAGQPVEKSVRPREPAGTADSPCPALMQPAAAEEGEGRGREGTGPDPDVADDDDNEDEDEEEVGLVALSASGQDLP